MLREDVDSDVKEALRRLPKAVYDLRTFRACRAFQLDVNRQVLPKAEWTKFEDVRFKKFRILNSSFVYMYIYIYSSHVMVKFSIIIFHLF